VGELMPLIARSARTYSQAPRLDRGELIQEGVVGVMRALERYDPSIGTPFWAYASWWVRQAMQQLVCEMSRPLVLSDRAVRQLTRVRTARRQLASELGREPAPKELARAAGLPPWKLQRLLAAERAPRALEARGAGAGSLGEAIRDPRAEDDFEALYIRVTAERLPRLLARLSERERAVIAGRYGLDEPPRTLEDIGHGMGVSAERVRQIEQRALMKMRRGPRDPRSRPQRGRAPRSAAGRRP
jgi:RNA polymerase sigma factor (sigma-70 family)